MNKDFGFPKLGPKFPESPHLSETGKRIRDAIVQKQDLLRAHALEGEELGVLAPATLQAMHEAGAFKITLPIELGGYALGARDTAEIVAALGQVDASAGWTVIVSNAARNTLAFPERARNEVFSVVDSWVGPLMFGATVLAPHVGEGRKVDGGFMVKGKWPFGSGCKIAAWGSVGIAYTDPTTGTQRRAMAILSRDQYEILDDWKVMGLKATSSNSVQAKEEIFVPDYRVVQMDELIGHLNGLRGKYEGLAFMHSPIGSMVAMTVSFAALALGMARGALAAFTEQAKKRAPFNVPYDTMSDMASIHVIAGKARAVINSCEAVLYRHADEVDRRAVAGEDFFPPDEPAITMDLVHQIHECLRTIDGLQLALGSSTVSVSNPIQRFVRDIHVLATHGAFRVDPMAEINGRDIFGLEPFSMMAALTPSSSAPPGPPRGPASGEPPGLRKP
ncbi:acyl-CoA dehydrogenase family protein [Burkholderia guangdongensis]|uniref:acyl-CoA dehydrogenase family protein n=1 Tax=Burkholderia guangdongensis TaxID=1792500 RepID=UPI0015C8D6C0|nr:acyl-CoA dehydrogenase family protein [Burkholderia guangdongensis]